VTGEKQIGDLSG